MKVLWAFEPFNQDKHTLKALVDFLQLFANDQSLDVGYVVTRNESELYLAFDIPAEERFSAYPLELVKKCFHEAKIKVSEKQIYIAEAPSPSMTKAVDTLLALAQKRKTELIALNSQNKKALTRLFIGSFAETAIHRSKIDLLIVPPKRALPTKLKHILYASDFGPLSKKHLASVFKLCRDQKADLTVFHGAPVTYRWSLDEASPEILKERRKIEKVKQSIEQAALKAGVRCSIVIKSEFQSTSELCLKTAAKVGADLLVVAAKSGPLKGLMGGSITRQIIRSSKKPVLVLR